MVGKLIKAMKYTLNVLSLSKAPLNANRSSDKKEPYGWREQVISIALLKDGICLSFLPLVTAKPGVADEISLPSDDDWSLDQFMSLHLARE